MEPNPGREVEAIRQSTPNESLMQLQPGTTLGPYSVTAKIGEGGMGEVYRARDTTLDRDVALKVRLRPSPLIQIASPALNEKPKCWLRPTIPASVVLQSNRSVLGRRWNSSWPCNSGGASVDH